MLKKLALLLMLALAACTVEVTTAPRPTGLPVLAPTPTLESPPTLAAQPTATADVPWAGLGLTGRMLFTEIAGGVKQLDLASGAVTALFTPPDPDQSWVNAAALAPDGRWLVMAYAPPPPAGQIQYGYTDLVVMSMGQNHALQPLLTRQLPQESFFNPSWSPDGKYIYYARLLPYIVPNTDPPQYGYQYNVERVSYPEGVVEVVALNAYWPRLSGDGLKLVYVSVDAKTFATALMVAEADGRNPVALTNINTFQAVDAPLFTPDGEQIIFSVVGEAQVPPALTLWERWSGLGVAEAHSVPSDWWSIPVAGNEPPRRLTKVFLINLFGAFAPDGQYMGFGSDRGLALMAADGTNLFELIKTERSIGTLDWVK